MQSVGTVCSKCSASVVKECFVAVVDALDALSTPLNATTRPASKTFAIILLAEC